MKPLFIPLSIIMSLVSIPSWSLTMEDLVRRDGLYYKKFTNVPFSGEIDEGLKQGHFKNGELQIGFTYFDNGQLRNEAAYLDGKHHGPFKSYYNNGQLHSEGLYQNGEKDGSWIYFHSNGQLWTKGTHRGGLTRHGFWESFHEDGTVDKQNTGTYENGVKISD